MIAQPFSVLLPVYHRDDPQHFDAAIRSITTNQTLSPAEVVLVIDGPIGDALNAVVDNWQRQTQQEVNVVRLPQNQGLSAALNRGLMACRHEHVARMDSDDVSLPTRFEAQMSYLSDNPDVALLGGWYWQCDQELNTRLTDRKVPSNHADIVRFAKTRTPFNHVTAIFKKSEVLRVGGYPKIRGYMEDWWIALRLIKQGCRLANLPQYLVEVRGDRAFIGRRGGWRYLRDEARNLTALRRDGLMETGDLIKNLTIRAAVRLLPVRARTLSYRAIRRF